MPQRLYLVPSGTRILFRIFFLCTEKKQSLWKQRQQVCPFEFQLPTLAQLTSLHGVFFLHVLSLPCFPPFCSSFLFGPFSRCAMGSPLKPSQHIVPYISLAFAFEVINLTALDQPHHKRFESFQIAFPFPHDLSRRWRPFLLLLRQEITFLRFPNCPINGPRLSDGSKNLYVDLVYEGCALFFLPP